MWQPLTGCNGDNRCNLRSGGLRGIGDMSVDGDHGNAKVGGLNGKTKKRHFFNENKVILGLH
jgi:hypothetical protein